jgi:hypothetical protein
LFSQLNYLDFYLVGGALNKSNRRFSRVVREIKIGSFSQLRFWLLGHFSPRSHSTYFGALVKDHKINMSRLSVEMHSFWGAKRRET